MAEQYFLIPATLYPVNNPVEFVAHKAVILVQTTVAEAMSPGVQNVEVLLVHALDNPVHPVLLHVKITARLAPMDKKILPFINV